jgi:hypothetical protein
VLGELCSAVRVLRRELVSIAELARRSGLLELADLYEDLKNCSEELTFVRNKRGKRYYYYYLKCKGKKTKSIYVGKSPEGYNQVKRAARLAHELKTRLEAVEVALRELEGTLLQLEENRALIEHVLSRAKKK